MKQQTEALSHDEGRSLVQFRMVEVGSTKRRQGLLERMARICFLILISTRGGRMSLPEQPRIQMSPGRLMS
jgi:hypothetical protein